MRPALCTAVVALAIPLGAPRAQQPAPIQGSLGMTFEDNFRRGDVELVRMPLLWSFGRGQPRRTLLEIEPSLGWHVTAGTTDASGLSYTRVRFYHVLPLGHGFSIGPDIEAYLKTESDTSLGFGYDRFMPGFQVGWQFRGDWRLNLRSRYEFSGGEDPGVKSLGRVLVRPAIYSAPLGRWSFWVRTDLIFDMHGGANQYNVEWLAGFRPDRHKRLTVYVEPRFYVGYASRTTNLWRLRSGLTWSLGDLVSHQTEGS